MFFRSSKKENHEFITYQTELASSFVYHNGETGCYTDWKTADIDTIVASSLLASVFEYV